MLAAALDAVAAEVEDAYGVEVEVVVVGDAPLDDRVAALLRRAREAMVNAAKHAAAARCRCTSRSSRARVEVFVRDRGAGFDPDAVPDDRLAWRESIVGRMARLGGHGHGRARRRATGTEVRADACPERATAPEPS